MSEKSSTFVSQNKNNKFNSTKTTIKMKAYEKGDMVVANENTLGFVTRCNNMVVTISVIATNYLNGGDPTLNGRTTCAMINKTRKANKADQDTYKCIIS